MEDAMRFCAQFIRIFVVIFLFYVPIKSVHALTVTASDFYLETLIATGATLKNSIQSATPFNPTLGTLEDIDLFFSGTVYFDINPASNFIPCGQAFCPAPYTVAPTLSIDIDGLNGFYGFDAPISVSGFVSVSGTGSPVLFMGNYSFRYNYNDFLDQFIGPTDVGVSGFTSFQPPINFVNSSLNDFIDSGSLIDDLLVSYELSFIEEGKNTAIPTITQATSVLQVQTTYTFTPHGVPESSSLVLIALGIVGLGFIRKRKAA